MYTVPLLPENSLFLRRRGHANLAVLNMLPNENLIAMNKYIGNLKK